MSAFTAEELGKHASSLRALALDLLGDEALAEDAVQDACVAALVRPPVGPVAAAAWLRKVVRNCALDLGRSERRRRRRERAVARSEATEEVDAAERLELQHEILAAVRSLDAPYRTAIWMRYYEHRSPSAIAAALGEPVKTVKTRLWRALQLLRQKLDHRYGDRRAWLGALAPLAKWSGRTWGLGAAVAAGALWMQAKHLVVAAILALALITGAAWVWSGEGMSPALHQALPEVSAHADPQPVADADPTRRVVAVEEGTSKSPTAASAYGSLAVRVRWHDGTSAPGIAIYCNVAGEPQLDRNELCLVSDKAGLARAPLVHAGKVTLSSERGGWMEAEVAAGLQREVDFLLPVGIDVTGVVRDERQLAVSGAEVVLVSSRAGWLSGRTVALTDPTGAFAVHAVNPTWSFGARKAGYAPSALVDLDDVARPAGATVHVQLRLTEPGACVVGTVVDETGAGIADATVALGKAMGAHFEIGHIGRETWSPQVVTTAADGSFRCDGTEPCMQPIVAWAEGCTRAQDTVQCVAGQTAKVKLVLARGVTVTGTVRNQAGDVVVGALVRSLAPMASEDAIDVVMHDGLDKRPQTRSEVNGRFVLRGIPAGTLRLAAAKPVVGQFFQYEAFTQVTLTGRAGEELTWNPVLTAGKKIRICVVDAEGRPTTIGWGFDAHAEEPAGLASVLRSALPERQPVGVYWFVGCADVPYTISSRLDTTDGLSRWLYRCHVIPGGPDVEIRLPPLPPPGEPGHVSGRIADLGHRLDGNALSVMMCTNTGCWRLPVNDGSFIAEKLSRGRYHIWAKAGETTILVGPWFELEAGQQLELGDLTTQPGARLRVALRAPAGADLGKPAASLGENFEWRDMRWDGAQLVAENVTAGKHRLTLRTPGWHAPPRDVDLVAGEDNVVTLDVVPGAHRKFDMVLPLPDRWQHCQIVLRDAAGTIVSECPEPTPGGAGMSPWGWHAEQPLGQFTLEAMLDGQLHTWPVDLRDPATGDRRLRFSLR